MLELSSEVRYIKGVGDVRMKLYQKLGIETVEQLLHHIPRRYLDLRETCPVRLMRPGEMTAVRAVVAAKGREQRIRRGLSIWKVTAVDGPDTLNLTFFNSRYAVEALQEGTEYIFYGKAEGTLLRREMNTPAIYPTDSAALVPVYALTAGLTSRSIGKNIAAALEALGELPDALPKPLREKYGLCGEDEAVRGVHFPESPEMAENARNRLIFDELLCLTLGLSRLRSGRAREKRTPMEPVSMQPFYDRLPFALTGAQRRVIREALGDLCSGTPMNRLVQGDVGSGKTAVAAACCWFSVRNGYQCAMMAPTDILARQHYQSLSVLLEPLGVRIGLLTGSATAKQKREQKAALAAGEIDLCVGTHALLTGDVAFARLGLVLTDEQHRFGVAQRLSLSQKGRGVNVLVMSATPIPRTLALIVYGDLEISVIDEMPAGRRKIDTYVIDSEKRERAFGYIRKHLDRGLQAYIVCPLVEESEDAAAELKAAAAYAEDLRQGSFSGYRVGLLHGRMKAKEKEAVMAAFAAGEIQLLVSTTVIEVGIDVPTAVIMMVENAERFGLSQLHQLRGRVGRGSEQSCCILLSDAKGEASRQRLETMRRTSDGFRIAEEDLKLRGPGDFFGMRQHGLPAMQIADLAADGQVLYKTQEAARALLQADPELKGLPLLAARVERMLGTAAGL